MIQRVEINLPPERLCLARPGEEEAEGTGGHINSIVVLNVV